MPYLLRTHSDQLLLLNHSVKSGLYSQTLSSAGLSRPVIINRSNTSNYSATIDHNQDLHIITQPSHEQIIHLQYKNNNVTRRIILEDPKGIYNFSNLHTICTKEHVHLFYTANQPIGNSCELIHHILCQENKIETCPIVSFLAEPLGFRYITHNNHIFLLYGEKSTHYLLQLMIYSDGKWCKPIPVATSSFPIDDFQFCNDDNGHIHVVYVQEKYGRYHLIYKKHQNNVWSDETVLHTSATATYPTIFTYHRGLWINFVDNRDFKMILSMDSGNIFSKSVDCSLQTSELERCNFVSGPDVLPSSFNCNTLYASLGFSIRASIVSTMDMINFHPDIKPNTELELFIDGVFHTFSLSHKSSPPPLPIVSPDTSVEIANFQAENQELKQVQEQMITQYNDMTELTKKIQGEGKKWRDKALALESQLEVYKSGIDNNPISEDHNVDIPSNKTIKNQDL